MPADRCGTEEIHGGRYLWRCDAPADHPGAYEERGHVFKPVIDYQDRAEVTCDA